jgi:lactate dehydrogenase-like 2-hydroxyacid dehydrogenase
MKNHLANTREVNYAWEEVEAVGVSSISTTTGGVGCGAIGRRFDAMVMLENRF